MRYPRSILAVFTLLHALYVPQAGSQDTKAIPPGHSLHGEAFDEGPRRQAWKMTGMGEVHFPVTTANPEAQAFFDQGVAQLHTFYYFEAERSFRQVAFIDPDCAMAYWGMGMANQNNGKRAGGFLGKAQDRAGKATDRERKYIDALAATHKEGKSDVERRGDYLRGLEAIVLAYPDDIEAKAFLAWAIVGGSWGGEKITSHVAVNVLIEEVLRKSPMHPGAHHYRIHLWDGHDPAQALASAQAYAKAAPGIAHAWHMPGHIYNGVCRWKEAVYQQEAAARIDHRHMLEHEVLPVQIHNYAHNQHYLIANISHLGAVGDGVAFSKNLIETPRDPGNDGAQRLGRASLMRILVRYERWDDILAGDHLDWSDSREDQAWKAYSRGLAHLGRGDRARAGDELVSLEKLAVEAAKTPGHEADIIETARLELRGRFKVSEDRLLEGFDLLSRGAKLFQDKLKGDLAGYPRPFLESVALAHLEAHNWGLAEACFLEVLNDRKGTFVSLAGLTEALERGGKHTEAAEAYERFLAAWKFADPGLPHRKRLEDLGVGLVDNARPDSTRAFVSGAGLLAPPELQSSAEPELPPGPRLWIPTPAPAFELEDSKGQKVKLESLRGKYAVTAFYLGSACTHCVEQLVALGKEKGAFEALGAQVIGLSEDPPERSRELLASPGGAAITFPLLTDPARKVAKLYGAHDTFEDLALHGLYLVDRQGGIRWFRVSAQPFMDLAFLKSEIERLNRLGVK